MPDILTTIKTEMQRQGVKPAELARRIGMSRQNLHAYMHGDRRPGLDILDRMAEALGLELRPKA